MNGRIIAAAGLMAMAVCFWQLGRPKAHVASEPFVAKPSQMKPAAVLSREMNPYAATINAPEGNIAEDVEALHALLTQYLLILKDRPGPPIGNDVDLAKILKGQNTLHRALLPTDHPSFGPNGRLIDRWGTPYHIHARGHSSFDVRSAGPDKHLFSEDDIVWPQRAES